MADETKQPPKPPTADTPEQRDAPRAQTTPRTDDKSASPGFESTTLQLCQPPPKEASASRPTPEVRPHRRAMLLRQFDDGTTVPASSRPFQEFSRAATEQSHSLRRASPAVAIPQRSDDSRCGKAARSPRRGSRCCPKQPPGISPRRAARRSPQPRAETLPSRRRHGRRPTDASITRW